MFVLSMFLVVVALSFAFLFGTDDEVVTYVAGVVAGFCTFLIGGAQKAGGPVRWTIFPSLKGAIGPLGFHIHHWFWLTILIVVFVSTQVLPASPWSSFVYGVCAGGVAHGLTFSDRFNLIYLK